MRSTAILGVLIATALPSPTTPIQSPEATTPTTPPTVVHQIGCTQKRFRRLARKVYAKSKITAADHEKLYQARRCLLNQKAALKYQRKLSAERRARLAIEAITPFKGPNGTRWAVPWKVVWCESHGSWSAANPSGAIGPYQLLGHGAPWPASSAQARYRHHQIAHNLWANQGYGPWTASRHCWS